MRTAIIFILCLTATAVMGSQVTKTLDKIQSSKFGQTLLATIQLELKSGAADPRGQINDLLNDMENQIQDDQAAHDQLISDVRAQFAADSDRLNARIGDLQNTIANAAADIDSQTTLRDTTQTQLELASGQINDLNVAQQNADDLRVAENEAFNNFQDKYNNLIGALNDVRGWIQDRQDEVANEGSFLQISTGSFLQVSNRIEAVSKKHPVVAPIFAMIKNKLKIYFDEDGNFVKGGVAGPNYNDITVDPIGHATEQFGNILNVIDGLIGTFTGYLDSSVDTEQAALADYQSTTADRQATIQAYEGQVAAYQATIAGAIAQISVDNAIIDQAQSELDAANVELAQDTQNYNDAEAYYAQRTQDRTDEVQTIEQVKAILANSLSNLGDYLENRIAASDDNGVVA